MNNQSTKVVTGPNTRWSFVHVFKPYDPNGNEATAKYSVCLIISKEDKDTIEAIKKAIETAYHDGQSKLKGNGKLPTLESLRTRHGAFLNGVCINGEISRGDALPETFEDKYYEALMYLNALYLDNIKTKSSQSRRTTNLWKLNHKA